MKNRYPKRFQLQLLFALVAAISTAVLAVEIVSAAVRHAEGFVLSDTSAALDHALRELDREHRLRAKDGSSWSDLTPGSQDSSLRMISQTVLSAYPGVEGGFWGRSGFAGYAYPTHDSGSQKTDIPAAERPDIEAVIAEARKQGRGRRILRGRHDLVVISAIADTAPDEGAIWVMKRLAGQAETAQYTQSVLLAALVGMALLGACGVLATGIGLTRGIAQITSGLAAIEREPSPELPVRRDELGRISAAINEMVRTRQRLESEIRREDRMRTVGRLVGRIAHEMRNPLNSMRLMLQMLAERHSRQRLRVEDFGGVIDEIDRIDGLLSDLLAFQQPRPAQMESCELRPLLDQCAAVVTPQADLREVRIDVAPVNGGTAQVDRRYFRQILENLLLNAIDVSARGDTVRVETSARDGRYLVEISDCGPGLNVEQQEHLFEPFYTTKASGHGLGLSVSKELAQSMNAQLLWRNRPAGGAVFTLQLERTS